MSATLIYNDYFECIDVRQREVIIWLRLYQRENGEYLAIATDCDDGRSVTNAAEELASAVRMRFLKAGDTLHWYEHYAPRKATQETMDLVTFSNDGLSYRDPQWKHSGREQVEELLGTSLAPTSLE